MVRMRLARVSGLQVREVNARTTGASAGGDEAHERYRKLRTALELLDDAGLLSDLQERWKEREAERDSERIARIEVKRQTQDEQRNGGAEDV